MRCIFLLLYITCCFDAQFPFVPLACIFYLLLLSHVGWPLSIFLPWAVWNFLSFLSSSESEVDVTPVLAKFFLLNSTSYFPFFLWLFSSFWPFSSFLSCFLGSFSSCPLFFTFVFFSHPVTFWRTRLFYHLGSVSLFWNLDFCSCRSPLLELTFRSTGTVAVVTTPSCSVSAYFSGFFFLPLLVALGVVMSIALVTSSLLAFSSWSVFSFKAIVSFSWTSTSDDTFDCLADACWLESFTFELFISLKPSLKAFCLFGSLYFSYFLSKEIHLWGLKKQPCEFQKRKWVVSFFWVVLRLYQEPHLWAGHSSPQRWGPQVWSHKSCFKGDARDPKSREEVQRCGRQENVGGGWEPMPPWQQEGENASWCPNAPARDYGHWGCGGRLAASAQVHASHLFHQLPQRCLNSSK